MPYSFADEPRAPLYVELTLSLVTMVVTMLFVAVALGRTDRLSDNRFILWGAAGAMALGSILAAFGETDSSVGMGALVRVFSSVLTGSGLGGPVRLLGRALLRHWGPGGLGGAGRRVVRRLHPRVLPVHPARPCGLGHHRRNSARLGVAFAPRSAAG